MTGNLSPEQLTAALEARVWTFAKTMPQWPHFWVARKGWKGEPSFTDVVQAIRDHGTPREWGKRKSVLHYFDAGEWRYWSMGWPPEETTIINRQKIAISTAVALDPKDPRWHLPPRPNGL